MSYAHIANKVLHAKWAITPAMLGSILSVLHSRMAHDHLSPEAAKAFTAHSPDRRFAVSKYSATTGLELPDAPANDVAPASATQTAPTTAVVFASGILGKHLSSMEEMCAGGLSVDRLTLALEEAAADPSIKNIVLWLDTPGGVVTGIPETRDLVAKIRETKTIVAYCDSLCASAGYWIASACDYIYCTRSADLGSIGVYSALLDVSAMYAAAGVKVELFKDGIYKAAGFPGTTLTDEQRAEILQSVLDTSTAFKADVTEARPQVKAATMEGQCLTGADAVKAGLADALVGSLAEVLADLAALKT
jgi:signal peptide peptidase SppA